MFVAEAIVSTLWYSWAIWLYCLKISKVLKKPKSDIGIQNICFRLDNENVENSLRLEEKIKAFYTKAYNQATEPRVKEIFFGLIEAEGDHIELIKERM